MAYLQANFKKILIFEFFLQMVMKGQVVLTGQRPPGTCLVTPWPGMNFCMSQEPNMTYWQEHFQKICIFECFANSQGKLSGTHWAKACWYLPESPGNLPYIFVWVKGMTWPTCRQTLRKFSYLSFFANGQGMSSGTHWAKACWYLPGTPGNLHWICV